MGFSAFNKVKDLRTAVADAGMEKTVQLMTDMNLVLGLLPDAGFEVGEVEMELGFAPKVTISLKVGGAVNEAKLKSLQEKTDNAMLSGIVASLIQASKMQNAVSLETLVLQDIEVVMTAAPTVSLHWRQRAGTKKTAAEAAASG